MKLFDRYGLAPLLTAAAVLLATAGCEKELTRASVHGAGALGTSDVDMHKISGVNAAGPHDIDTSETPYALGVSIPVTFGALADPRNGKTYRTATLGGQTWMTENLNCAPESGDSWCYKNDKDSCNKYGRLYDWLTARGICPAGWHLPAAWEWDELTGWVNLVAGGNAAKMLATAGGWFEYKERENLDETKNVCGFSALPGGSREPGGEFDGAGYTGFWWTDTEADGNRAYERVITFDEYVVTSHNYGSHKKTGYSVRCVMDGGEPAAYTLALKAADGGSAVAYPNKASYDAGKRVTLAAVPKTGYLFYKWTGGRVANDTSAFTTVTMDSNMTVTAEFRPVPYGALADPRDGRTYRTVKMPDGMVWMAENLNYAPPGGNSWAYGNHTVYSDKYGRLYDWKTANAACPEGWRLPSREEWDKLGKAAGGAPKRNKSGNIKWRGAGKKLKATGGWGDNREKHRETGNWNGTDDYGFSALPGGHLCGVDDCSGRDYYGAGDDFRFSWREYGSWWTATENNGRKAFYRQILLKSADLEENDSHKSDGRSVRCVAGEEKFVSATAPATYSLTLTAIDLARGSVSAGLAPGSVSADPVKTLYTAGEKVTVSATPNCGFVFAEWLGGKTADPTSATTTVTVNSNMTVGARFTRVTPYIARGSFTDGRDGKTYKTTQVCQYVWMADNLNYEAEVDGGCRDGVAPEEKERGKYKGGKDSDCKKRISVCYDGKDSNCEKYGRLYDWETAAKVCPAGWHLASAEEWNALEGYADGWEIEETEGRRIGGWRLKAKSGWKTDNGRDGGNGADEFGFSALPGGAFIPPDKDKTEYADNDYIKAGEFGGWWSRGGENNAFILQSIRSNNSYVDTRSFYGDFGASVRCVGDRAGHVPAPAALKLTLTAGTGGSVSVVPNKASYIAGERVTVSAVPDKGYTFAKWTGGKVADTGYAVTVVTVNSNMTVAAKFNKSKAPPTARGSLTDARDGKKYETVTLNGKAWMARNLDYETPKGSWCYGDAADSCAKYGRLYDWNAAKTACPAGWHLPDSSEWSALVKVAGGEKAAGVKLKATSGWNFFGRGWVRTGNGTDYYGFAALPGGYRDSNGKFQYTGEYGYWWTATEDEKDDERAYIRRMEEGDKGVNWGYYADDNVKDNGLSVRCVIDEAAPYSLTLTAGTGGSVSAKPAKASYKAGEQVLITAVPDKGYTFAGWTGGRLANAGYAATTVALDSSMTVTANFNKSGAPPAACSTLTDTRDKTRYKTVKLGGRTWMAENLNYQMPKDSWCYDDKTGNCAKYGRLYNWDAAENACPAGWHLPTREEWGNLVEAAGGGKAADKTLKSVSGWSRAGNGTDMYGFSALPGGYWDYLSGVFESIGNMGIWWTATPQEFMNFGAYAWRMTSDSGKAIDNTHYKSAGFSVRCVMDEDGALTVVAAAGGTVSVIPRKASYKPGEQVKITARPDSGYAFAGWSGGSVTGTGVETVTVVMNANMTVKAGFRRIVFETLSDKRDGKTYKTVKIGRNTWMAENLNYTPPEGGSRCYKDDTSYCGKYGRLYDWETAMKACPAGWHLSSLAEWDSLAAEAGGWHYTQMRTWYEAGGRLKSKTGWGVWSDVANTDNFGFSALPGGEYYNSGGFKNRYEYVGDGNSGYWWTSTQRDGNRACRRELEAMTNSVGEDDRGKGDAYSVRCVMDKK